MTDRLNNNNTGLIIHCPGLRICRVLNTTVIFSLTYYCKKLLQKTQLQFKNIAAGFFLVPGSFLPEHLPYKHQRAAGLI